jgi:hypothetical protein
LGDAESIMDVAQIVSVGNTRVLSNQADKEESRGLLYPHDDIYARFIKQYYRSRYEWDEGRPNTDWIPDCWDQAQWSGS